MTVIAANPILPSQRLFLPEVTWEYYLRTLDEAADGHVRITFDRGRMEMMVPSFEHEGVKRAVGRLIEMYAVEHDVPVMAAGSVTCRRGDLQRGLEPDECYYIATPCPPLTREPLDLSIHPPPDLGVEVDITHSSIPREPIYAALGVPEVWRFDGRQVVVLHRQANGTYLESTQSLCFAELSMADFNRFLQQALSGDQHRAVVAFRDWLRQPDAANAKHAGADRKPGGPRRRRK